MSRDEICEYNSICLLLARLTWKYGKKDLRQYLDLRKGKIDM